MDMTGPGLAGDCSALATGVVATSFLLFVVLLFVLSLGLLIRRLGDPVILINGGSRRLRAKKGLSLLSALSSGGVYMPSVCGGKAACGTCKCRVLSDSGPLLPAELPYLTSAERASRYRLSCQVMVEEDLEIALPEEFFAVRKHRARVERIRDLTWDIKEILFDLQGGTIAFRPGQYVQLEVPAYGKVPESVQRAYSISSRPSDKGHVEILVRLVPGGIATSWAHTRLREGDQAGLVGPFGSFGAREGDATMLCVGGGSGMAPFKSIFGHMEETDAWPAREIWYFFGARTRKDLFYLDELRDLERRMPRFHLVAALSEPEAGETWTGERGLITDILDIYIKERIPKDRPFEGYLCGSPGMINACTKVMTRNGVPLEDIYYDKFS
jgi:Na+-transporting NADH:ubiquinone oxidoreductase subunit F